MRKKSYKGLLSLFSFACVEEVPVQTEVQSAFAVADVLVADARISDELKNHEVKLTRIFALEGEDAVFETGAQVRVVDDQGANFTFEEATPGTYLLEMAFAAEQGRLYRLEITLANGKKYTSKEVALPSAVPIADIRAKRIINGRDEEGIGIFLDNDSSGEEPTFFRYEYEETYKIIVPKWDPFRLDVVKSVPCDTLDPFIVDIVPWEDERRVSFGSSRSKRLIQASSTDLTGNTLDNFRLHFIPKDNYIISHRYSMNVIQYAQTADANSFYKRLGDFSSSENIFSQIKPGFLEGNIALESNPDEFALGYFEVTSVSRRRMYFNYVDLFPGEALPPYVLSCEEFQNPDLLPPFAPLCFGPFSECYGNCDSPLIELILAGSVTFAAENEDDALRPYYTWPSVCGDCTQLGSNVVPEFWTEE